MSHKELISNVFVGVQGAVFSKRAPWLLFLFLSSLLSNAAQYRVTGAVSSEGRAEVEDILIAAGKQYLPRFGLTPDFRLNVYICKDLQEFRRLTGVRWWNGGHFKIVNRTIYLQRLEVLRQRGILRKTLVHEFLHYCIWRVTGRNFSLWMAEGLVLNLSGEMAKMDCPSESIVFNDEFVKGLNQDLVSADRERQRLAYCRAGELVRQILERRRVYDLLWEYKIPSQK